jgi:hypothetical protein
VQHVRAMLSAQVLCSTTRVIPSMRAVAVSNDTGKRRMSGAKYIIRRCRVTKKDDTNSEQQQAAVPTYRVEHPPTYVQLPTHVETSGARGETRLETLAESACRDRRRSIRANHVRPAEGYQGVVGALLSQHTSRS